MRTAIWRQRFDNSSRKLPMTTRIKGHPFEVRVDVAGVESAILSDQVKSLDWKVRRARKRGEISQDAMRHVRAKLKALLLVD